MTDTGASFLDLIDPVVALLLVLSVVALTIILAKIAQFTMLRVGSHAKPREAVKLWREGQAEQAMRLLISEKSASAELLRGVMKDIHGIGSDIDAENRLHRLEGLRENATATAADRLFSLAGWLRGIDLIAQIAPLLGLFGTVVGMIETFRTLQQLAGSADAGQLAGGIWTALLTTACGLAVAIPASAAVSWLEGRLEKERTAWEVLLTGIFTAQIPPAVSERP